MLDNVYTVSLYLLLCENIYNSDRVMNVSHGIVPPLISPQLNYMKVDCRAIFTSANLCFLKRRNLILFNVIYYARLVKKRQA